MTVAAHFDLSIIPSTITRQPDGSHKVQLSLNGILTGSTNDLPKDLTDDEIRELVSSRAKIRAHVLDWVDAVNIGLQTPARGHKQACKSLTCRFFISVSPKLSPIRLARCVLLNSLGNTKSS